MASLTTSPNPSTVSTALQSVIEPSPDALRLIPLEAAFLVPVEFIKAVKQPRTQFETEEDEELVEQLAEERALKGGIAGTGILQALLLRPADVYGHEFLIVAGERRFRAARRIGIPAVPAYIKEMSPSEAWRSAIIENIQRKNLQPLEQGEAFEEWKVSEGLTDSDIAKKIGKSPTYVREMIAHINRASDLKELLIAKPDTTRAVRLLGSLPKDARATFVRQLSEGASYNSLAEGIKEARERHNSQQEKAKMEAETSPRKFNGGSVIRAPRTPYATLISSIDGAVDLAITVCADLPPTGLQKRNMQKMIEKMRERLDHLESLI